MIKTIGGRLQVGTRFKFSWNYQSIRTFFFLSLCPYIITTTLPIAYLRLWHLSISLPSYKPMLLFLVIHLWNNINPPFFPYHFNLYKTSLRTRYNWNHSPNNPSSQPTVTPRNEIIKPARTQPPFHSDERERRAN